MKGVDGIEERGDVSLLGVPLGEIELKVRRLWVVAANVFQGRGSLQRRSQGVVRPPQVASPSRREVRTPSIVIVRVIWDVVVETIPDASVGPFHSAAEHLATFGRLDVVVVEEHLTDLLVIFQNRQRLLNVPVRDEKVPVVFEV